MIVKWKYLPDQGLTFNARDRNILPSHNLILFVSKRMKDFYEHISNLLRQENKKGEKAEWTRSTEMNVAPAIVFYC